MTQSPYHSLPKQENDMDSITKMSTYADEEYLTGEVVPSVQSSPSKLPTVSSEPCHFNEDTSTQPSSPAEISAPDSLRNSSDVASEEAPTQLSSHSELPTSSSPPKPLATLVNYTPTIQQKKSMRTYSNQMKQDTQARLRELYEKSSRTRENPRHISPALNPFHNNNEVEKEKLAKFWEESAPLTWEDPDGRMILSALGCSVKDVTFGTGEINYSQRQLRRFDGSRNLQSAYREEDGVEFPFHMGPSTPTSLAADEDPPTASDGNFGVPFRHVEHITAGEKKDSCISLVHLDGHVEEQNQKVDKNGRGRKVKRWIEKRRRGSRTQDFNLPEVPARIQPLMGSGGRGNTAGNGERGEADGAETTGNKRLKRVWTWLRRIVGSAKTHA